MHMFRNIYEFVLAIHWQEANRKSDDWNKLHILHTDSFFFSSVVCLVLIWKYKQANITSGGIRSSFVTADSWLSFTEAINVRGNR